MRSITTSLSSPSELGRLKGLVRLAVLAVLAASALALIPTASFAAPCQDCEEQESGGGSTGGSKYQYVVSEYSGRKETGLYGVAPSAARNPTLSVCRQ
jgi:opacity protein-like surface antigen